MNISLNSEIFVDLVTRLVGLYVLIETPQQNLDSKDDEDDEDDDDDDSDDSVMNSPGKGEDVPTGDRVVKHISKVLMSPQQYELLVSSVKHRYRTTFKIYLIFANMHAIPGLHPPDFK